MTSLTERTLTFRQPIPGDAELTPDQHAVFLRLLGEQVSSFSMLHGLVKGKTAVSKELTHNVVYVAESRTADICKLLGLEMDSVAERSKRTEEIRAVNIQNHELRRQLGLTGTVEQTKAHIKTVSAALRDWWEKAGFGHVSEIRFNEYGAAEVEFSLSLYGAFQLTRSETPVSDAEAKKHWHKELEDRGFKLLHSRNERDPEILDCDQNRAALVALFTSAFPTCQMSKTENYFKSDCNSMVLRSAHVYLRDISEVAIPLSDTE